MKALTDYAFLVDTAHESVAQQAIVIGPAGYAYATPGRLAGPVRWLSATTGHWLEGATVRTADNRVAGHFGLACVRLAGTREGEPAVAPDKLRHSLLRAHTALLAHVVVLTVADLGGRVAAGSPLLGRQLVQAGIADAALLVDQTEGLLAGDPVSPDGHAAVFARLVHGGRALLRLLGAASFLIDGPGGAILAAEQVGTLYLGRSPSEGAL